MEPSEYIDNAIRQRVEQIETQRAQAEAETRRLQKQLEDFQQRIQVLESSEKKGKWQPLESPPWTTIRHLGLSWLNAPTSIRPDRVLVPDPIYETLELPEEVGALLCLPALQRLNHIRQLGPAYIPFPNAQHTRLAHSLGTAWLANRTMRKIWSRGVMYFESPVPAATNAKPTQKRAILTQGAINVQDAAFRQISLFAIITALLHDIGHGPFAHAIEKMLAPKVGSPDKALGAEIIQHRVKAQAGHLASIDFDLVARLVGGKEKQSLAGWARFCADLIDASVDIDRMDYLARDSHFTGLREGQSVGTDLLAHMVPVRLTNDQIVLAFESEAVTPLENFLYVRELMYRNCYEHPNKLAAEKLLRYIVSAFLKELAQHGAPPKTANAYLRLLADFQLMQVVQLYAAPGTLCRRALDFFLTSPKYRLLDDHQCAPRTPPDPNGQERDEIKDNVDKWEASLREAAPELKTEEWRLFLTYTKDTAITDKELGVDIIRRDGTGAIYRETLAEASTLLKDSKGQVRIIDLLRKDRSKLRVLIAGEIAPATEERVRTQFRKLCAGI